MKQNSIDYGRNACNLLTVFQVLSIFFYIGLFIAGLFITTSGNETWNITGVYFIIFSIPTMVSNLLSLQIIKNYILMLMYKNKKE